MGIGTDRQVSPPIRAKRRRGVRLGELWRHVQSPSQLHTRPLNPPSQSRHWPAAPVHLAKPSRDLSDPPWGLIQPPAAGTGAWLCLVSCLVPRVPLHAMPELCRPNADVADASRCGALPARFRHDLVRSSLASLSAVDRSYSLTQLTPYTITTLPNRASWLHQLC